MEEERCLHPSWWFQIKAGVTSAADTLTGTLLVDHELDKMQWEWALLQKEAMQLATGVGVWLWGHPGGLWVIWREAATLSGPSPHPVEWWVLEVFLMGNPKSPWAFTAWAGPLISMHVLQGTVKASRDKPASGWHTCVEACKGTEEHLGTDFLKQGENHRPTRPGETTACAFRSGKRGQMESTWSDLGAAYERLSLFLVPFFTCFLSGLPPAAFKGHPWGVAS